MQDVDSDASAYRPRTSKLHWGFALLGLAFTANLVDLVTRTTEPDALATPYASYLLAAQAAVCGLLFLLMLFAAFCLGARAGRASRLERLRARREATPVEVSY
jgi:hypothetical protein